MYRSLDLKQIKQLPSPHSLQRDENKLVLFVKISHPSQRAPDTYNLFHCRN